jgi:energy-converting hydrogenase A subunit M
VFVRDVSTELEDKLELFVSEAGYLLNTRAKQAAIELLDHETHRVDAALTLCVLTQWVGDSVAKRSERTSSRIR